MAEALAEVMTEGAFINGAIIGISENRHDPALVLGIFQKSGPFQQNGTFFRKIPKTRAGSSMSALNHSKTVDGSQKSRLAPH